MKLNVVWCPLSERVGTIEVENQIIQYLIDKNKKVYSLGISSYLKKTHLSNGSIGLLPKNYIKFTLKNSKILYGRFTIFLQSSLGLIKLFKIFLSNKNCEIIIYSCLFPTPLLLAKSFLKLFNCQDSIKIINFIQGTPSFLRTKNQKRNPYFYFENILRKIIYTNLYKNSNYIICSSHRLADQISNYLDKRLIKVIPNGILKELPKRKNLLYLKESNLNKNKIKLYFIGRLTYQKNIIFLLEEFIKNYKNDNTIDLTVIGNGDLFDKVNKEYSKFNNIIFLGFIKDPWKVIKKDGIIIVPSLWEEPGHVPLEAFLNNKRFFISKGCSLSDFIHQDFKSNLVFELKELSHLLKNIRVISDGKNWYKIFPKLNISFEKFTYKSFQESLNQLSI